jgi:uncharacterized repeat protein (TIGR04138 family)
MSTTKTTIPRLRYHSNAYLFVCAALRHTQENLGRGTAHDAADDDAHISGGELLDGIRELAVDQFGLMATAVFRRWGVRSTEDFGRIVFELIERGEMRKTDRDQLSDFVDIYEFEEAFDRGYRINTSGVFRK